MISPPEATLYGVLLTAVSGAAGAVLAHRFRRKEAAPGIDAQLRDQLLGLLKQQREDQDRLQQRFDQADLIIAGWRGRHDEQYRAHQELLLRYDEQERRCAAAREQLNDASAELVKANVDLHEGREQYAEAMAQMAGLRAELEAERVVRQSLEALQQVKAQNHV